MSDQMDNVEANEVGANGKAGQETILELNLSKKGPDMENIVQDGGDPVMKSELAGVEVGGALGEAIKAEAKENAEAALAASKLSKRKRKNRRRRQKKAASGVGTDGVSPRLNDSEIGTGTETDYSEDVSKAGEESAGTGTDGEAEHEPSSSSVDTSIDTVATSAKRPGTPAVENAPASTSADEKDQEQAPAAQQKPSGPSSSVETLLQIAKDKLGGIFRHSDKDKSGKVDSNSGETAQSCVVPPCSPSSNQNLRLNQQELIGELNKLQQSEQSKSKETIVLVGNVGPSESATSSVASMESAGSLLKGNGSSCEEIPDSAASYHYPSREAVEDAADPANNVEAYRETIQIFKMQNPEETRYIGEEVDSILSRSLDKFSSLMGRSKQRNGTEPTLVSYKTLPEDGESSNQQQLPDDNAPTGSESEHAPHNSDSACFEVAGDVAFCASDISAGDEGSGVNTTFVIENEQDESDFEVPSIASPLPLDLDTAPVREAASSTFDVASDSNLSVVFEVPEEDKTLNLELEPEEESRSPAHRTVSEASSVVEALSVQYLPSEEAEGKDEEAGSGSSGSEEVSKMCGGSYADKLLLKLEIPSESAVKGADSANNNAEAASLQQTKQDGGDQPCLQQLTPVNNNATREGGPSGSGRSSPPDNEHDYWNRANYNNFVDVDTESDCPWLPERVESLTKVISEKEKREIAARNKGQPEAGTSSGSKQEKKGTLKKSKSNEGGSQQQVEADEQGPSCACAKMCVVM